MDSTHDSSLRPELSPLVRRRAFWIGLVSIWLFTAGFLQFGLIDRLALPASERVNNGDQATFFAVHINPYFTFSEDFHLYVVRSKRILDRGWTDALLASTADAKSNYSSPLQALLMMLAVATDGRPIPYSLFIFGVLATSWSILYISATLWLPRNISPLSIPSIVLFTALFESVDVFFHAVDGDFAQWPVHRGLRMATLAWSNPLSASILLASMSLLFRREKPWGRIAFAGTLLGVLAAADTWSFLLCTVCVSMVLASMGIVLVFGRRWLVDGIRPLIIAGIGLGMVLALAMAIHLATSAGWTGDVLARAGFGPEWRNSSFSVENTRTFYRIARTNFVVIAALVVLVTIYAKVRFVPGSRSLQTEFNIAPASPTRLHLLCLAVNPMLAMPLTVAILGKIGMDEYHGYQFAWRMEYMMLLCLAVAVAEGVKVTCRNIAKLPQKSFRLELAVAVGFVLVLFTYHNYRIYHFVSQTAGREFFLTRDEEALRDWLRGREPNAGRYSLATASHELNYLCAYWTNADLLLPEGFPFHSALSNDEIEQRTAHLLAVYGATPESWEKFVLHRHVWDQWSWGLSRTLSARHGYMYYLMHRNLLVKGNRADPPPPSFPEFTTPRLAERRLNHEERVADGRFVTHEEGVYAAGRIGKRLADLPPLQADEMPDVIVVDDVSRALGSAKLDGYRRDFHHGEIEGWVRTGSRVAQRPGK